MKAHKDKNLKKSVLYEGRFIRLVRKGKWEYIERPHGSDVVIILAMTNKSEIILFAMFNEFLEIIH